MAEQEGRLAVDTAGHEIYYRLFGSGSETLVGLHGGPGADHRYLSRLGELAGDGLQVLLYDQLGSGKSDRPDDSSLWVVPRFVEELEKVRTELGLGQMHLSVSPGAASSPCSTRSTIPRAYAASSCRTPERASPRSSAA